jgi:tyrosine-protein kinase Etk/Wzc
MTPQTYQEREPAVTPPQPQLRELDLFGFVAMMLRQLPFILGCGAVSFLVMVVMMLHAKPRFASTAVMIVPQGNVTSRSLEEQLSANTIDMLGGGFELYSDILTSRTIADRIIKDFNLKKVYGVQRDEYAEGILGGLTKVTVQHEGLIRVTVQDSDQQRAADIANDYLHQLDALNYQLVLTSIKAQRVYVEHEMIAEKNALADAEVALKQVQESTSGLTPDAQANAGLNAVETTRAELRAAEIRLDTLLVSETESNPEVVRTRQQVSSLTGQLISLQRGVSTNENGTPTANVPEQTLVYTRLLREVKFHETLFDLLEKQFEGAKQEESKTPSIVQVLDPAVPSVQKAWPPRTYYCVLAGVGGTIAGVFLVVLWGFGSSYVRNPRNAEKLKQLKTIYKKQPSRRL